MDITKKVTIDGVEYTLQKPTYEGYLDILQRTKNATDVKQLAIEIFEHIVVNPRVCFDDFDDNFSAADQLIMEAQRFLMERTKKAQKS